METLTALHELSRIARADAPHVPNDVTRYRIGPGPLRCGIHGDPIGSSRCATCGGGRQ